MQLGFDLPQARAPRYRVERFATSWRVLRGEGAATAAAATFAFTNRPGSEEGARLDALGRCAFLNTHDKGR